jgi:hypothetical protein
MNFTDALHDAFGFRTDYQIVSNRTKTLKIFLNRQKSENITHFLNN